MRGNETPGARPSTAMIAMSRWPAPSPVWHTTRNRSASPASDTQALRPLTRQLCPSGRATVVIAVASDPACGSVSEKPPSASPVRSRSPHVAISSGDPARVQGRGHGVVHRQREGEGGVTASQLLEHPHAVRVRQAQAAGRLRHEQRGQPGGGRQLARVAPAALPAGHLRAHVVVDQRPCPIDAGLRGGHPRIIGLWLASAGDSCFARGYSRKEFRCSATGAARHGLRSGGCRGSATTAPTTRSRSGSSAVPGRCGRSAARSTWTSAPTARCTRTTTCSRDSRWAMRWRLRTRRCTPIWT